MNTSLQTVYLLNTSHTYEIINDADGNPTIIMSLSPVPAFENVTVSYSLKIETVTEEPPLINFSSSGNINEIPKELQNYTLRVGSWLTENQSLKNLAYQIKGEKTNVLEIVTSLADWIGNSISSYSSDYPLYPTETYNSKRGDCDDQANLLITLCRILGIPAYLQIGLLETASQKQETYFEGHITYYTKHISYHAWAIIYVPPWGWLPFDMTLGWDPFSSLKIITSAPIWSSNTVQMWNITQSDWAGEGRKEKEILNSQLYIQYEDILSSEQWEPM